MKLWSKKGKETEYSLRAIPIGGFCQMAGEDMEDDDLKKIPKDKRLQSKSVWQRFLIMFFGAGNNFISATVPREDLFAVQTPQVFKTDLYRVALALAKQDGFVVTDDCSLAEHAGFSVKLCELSGPNYKLTTEEDLLTITAILKEREND